MVRREGERKREREQGDGEEEIRYFMFLDYIYSSLISG